MRTSRSARRGYTAIEVMVAMTLLAIGAAGVISMERGAILGNVEARRLDTANAIAHMWLDRLQSDAMMWTTPNRYISSDNRASAAPLLATVNASDNGDWHIPTAYQTATPPLTGAADVVGHDVPVSASWDDSGIYCTYVRLTWLVTNSLMRAEVRVVWARDTYNGSFTSFCTEPAPSAIIDATNAVQNFHFVYATTSIRQNTFYNR